MLRNAKPYDLIAVNLRIAWSDLVTERLPKRLRRLLQRLADEEEARRQANGAGGRNAGKPHRGSAFD